MTYKFYEILGLNKNNNPSKQEIKKAYHKKALKHHPDKNPNDKENEILFKEISNAYTILSDENKKRAYDNLGDNNYQDGNQHDMNPEDIFQHFLEIRVVHLVHLLHQVLILNLIENKIKNVLILQK